MYFHRLYILGRVASVLASTTTCTSAVRSTPHPVGGTPVRVTAFVNVAVIPMDTERVLLNQTVLVENGRITALGPVSRVEVSKKAVRIDGQGKYLMPGLADMHAHLFLTNEAADSLGVERRLLLWVANGVTTIRNADYVNQKNGERTLRLRARAAAGEILSPRIYTSGPWAPRQYTASGMNAPAPRLDSVAAYVAAYKAAGYDFIKVHDESQEVIDSVGLAARRVGIPIMGHTRIGGREPEETLAWAAKVGYASIEHLVAYRGMLPYYRNLMKLPPTEVPTPDTARIRALAEATQRAGIWNCPTLGFAYTQDGSSGGKYSDTNTVFFGQLTKALQDAGAGLLLGTDVPPGNSDLEFVRDGHGFVHKELQALVRVGLTPYQALATGTRNVAQYFGTLDSTGTIAVGKRADLVLLGGNPLTDIRHTMQPAGRDARRTVAAANGDRSAFGEHQGRLRAPGLPPVVAAGIVRLASLRATQDPI
jgi:imidazolonepropionase-like amidohydrolase